MASGEMSEVEFISFLNNCLGLIADNSANNSVHYSIGTILDDPSGSHKHCVDGLTSLFFRCQSRLKVLGHQCMTAQPKNHPPIRAGDYTYGVNERREDFDKTRPDFATDIRALVVSNHRHSEA